MQLQTDGVSVEKPDTTTVNNACRVVDKRVFWNLKLHLHDPQEDVRQVPDTDIPRI